MLHTALMVDAFLVRKWSSQGPTSTYQRLHLCQCSASHHRWQFSKSNLDESERGSLLCEKAKPAKCMSFLAREHTSGLTCFRVEVRGAWLLPPHTRDIQEQLRSTTT